MLITPSSHSHAGQYQSQVPSIIRMIKKTTIVPRHPPPSFAAPAPAISPLNMLFIFYFKGIRSKTHGRSF